MVSPEQQPTTPGEEEYCIVGDEVDTVSIMEVKPVPLEQDDQGNVRVNVFFPDFSIQKCFVFDPDENVFEAKLLILEAMDEQLYDPMNYGVYLPPINGKAGKFLDEERPLDDYKLQGPIGKLEFKYKRRVYRMCNLNHKKLRLLHTKSTMKQFCDSVKGNNVDRVTKLVEKGLDPNYIDNETGETPLTLATKVSRCRNLILQLVSGGAHLDFRNRKSHTPVHTAAYNGNAEAIKALLELGASPNYKDKYRLSPLYHLSRRRQSPALCAELLLRDYAIIGCKDEAGNTELHQACKNGNYRVAEMLIFYGAEMDYQSVTGATPLHICAANAELSCLQTLLVRGADKSVMNNTRQTPLQVAVVSRHKEAAEILDKHDELLVVPFEDPPTYNQNRRLAGANLEAMRLLSKSDPRINLSASVMNLSTSDSMSQSYSMYNGRNLGSRSDLGHLGLYDSVSVSRTLRRTSSTKSASFGHRLHSALPGRSFQCIEDYEPQCTGELRLKKGDTVTVMGVGDNGMWEGKLDEKEGWFPSEVVTEQKRKSLGARAQSSDATLQRHNSQSANGPEGIRTVVLAKTKKGYGFVLRGAKAEQLKKLEVKFVPSERMPALQYLDSVEKGSVSDKAGLRAGDFILEIDGHNVVQASHEQTVQIIKRSGDVLAMKVIRAVRDNSNIGYMDGTQTLPSRRSQTENLSNGHEVIMRKKSPEKLPNGNMTEEAKALEQLDATLANYDSDSRSSSSGTVPTSTTKEQKTASIRQRPLSSHFNSIQELDDMFVEPAKNEGTFVPPSHPVTDKGARKPAKNKVKKFWSRGRSNKLDKSRSLSQSDLADLSGLDSEGVRPITMYEMRAGHSFDVGAPLTRTLSGDLKQMNMNASPGFVVPPPPAFPAPPAPEEGSDTASLRSAPPGYSVATVESSFKPGTFARVSNSSSMPDSTTTTTAEKKRFLPRTPLPTSPTGNNHRAVFSTLPRARQGPPPPARSSSHESSILLAVQGHKQVSPRVSMSSSSSSPVALGSANQSSDIPTPPPMPNQTQVNPTVTSTDSFSAAIRKAAVERESREPTSDTKPVQNGAPGAIMGNEIYAAVQKRKSNPSGSDIQRKISENKPANQGANTVEDQLRAAVAKRRTVMERSDSDRSATPERLLDAPPVPPKLDVVLSETTTASTTTTSTVTTTATSTVTTSQSSDSGTNFRALAEQKRLEWIKKQSNSSTDTQSPTPSPAVVKKSSADETDANMTELQQIMSRLATNMPTEENNNKKKLPPPQVMKKPNKGEHKEVSALSPVEEFPPLPEFPSPPPPSEFDKSGASEIAILPPSFEVAPPSQFSPPPPAFTRHDVDNHSLTSSVGSDNMSSVSQDNNRLSVATSGYSSDPSRNHKPTNTGKNVESWGTSEVGDWLDTIGLGEYKVVFADNCIEGETLVSMGKSDIKELGVEKVGHRVKIDKEIKKLIGESSA